MKKWIFNKEWSISEINDLEYGIKKKGYSFKTIKEKLLPFRSIEALELKAKLLGLKHSKVLTDYELKVLREGLEKGMTYKQIRDESLSHRKINALKSKAQIKGWTKNFNIPWNQKDLNLLEKGIKEGLTYKEIVEKYLSNRTEKALNRKAQKQGWTTAKPWLMNELFLLDLGLYKRLSLQKIQKQSLPQRPLLHLQARIEVPNWTASLYDWHLPFNKDDIRLAWIAGFIQADGHIDARQRIQINLQKRDRHLLEFICDVFQLPHSKIGKSTNNKDVRLILCSTLGRLFQKHFHLSPNKSKGQVVFPHFLNHRCQKAFLLGLWYADGIKYSSGYTIGFLSSLKFLKHLLKYAKKYGFFLHYTYKKIRKRPTPSQLDFDLAELFFHGRQAILFFRFLAKDEIMNQIPPLNRKIQDLLTCSLPQDNKWSTSENNILRILLKHRRHWTYKHISTFFKNRTYTAVYGQIKKLQFNLRFPRIKSKGSTKTP